jgi:2-dehydropantoate 2-reductase
LSPVIEGQIGSFGNVLILGAGAIGSFYGSQLSRGAEVILVGKEAHVEAINRQGLIVSGEVEGTYRLRAITELIDIGEDALLILTTKAHDTEGAIMGIKDLLRQDTTILVLQNGLGNEEMVRSIIAEEVEVLRGLSSNGVEFTEPGMINVTLVRETVLPGTPTGKRVSRLFEDCGLRVRLAEDMEREVWRKLVMNCIINPLTAVFKVRNKEIVADSLRYVRERVAEECLEVAGAEGVSLEPSLVEEVTKAAASYSNLSSMCQDILKGRRTEIDFLNGRIVELGRRHGVPTPVNTTLTSLIKFMEGRK